MTTTITSKIVCLTTLALVSAVMMTSISNVEADAQVLTIGAGEAATVTASCRYPNQQLSARIGITGPEGQWVATRIWVLTR